MSNQLANRTRFFRTLADSIASDDATSRAGHHDMIDLMLALARTQGSAPLAKGVDLDINKVIEDLEAVQNYGRPKGLQWSRPVRSVRSNIAHHAAQVTRALSQHIDQQLSAAGAYAYYAREIVDDAITTFEQQERIAFEGKRPPKPEDVARLVALNAAIERERNAGVTGGFPRQGLTVPQEVIDEVREAATELAQSPISILMAVEKGPDTVNLSNVRRVVQAFDGNLLDIIVTRSNRALAGTITATETKMADNGLQGLIAKAVTEAGNTGSSQVEPRHLFLALLGEPAIENEVSRLNRKALTQNTIPAMQAALGRRADLVGQPAIPGARQTSSFKRAVADLRPIFEDGQPKARSKAVQTLLRANPEIRMLLKEHAGLTDKRAALWLEVSQTADEQVTKPAYKISDEVFKEALAKYTRNVTDMARAGTLPKIIGREDELRQIKRIMTHADKKNPIVIGEPGVGKTALLHAYAQAVVAGDVPSNQQGMEVYELDLGALISGTTYRGDFEKRLRDVVQGMAERNAAGDGRYFIGIDEAHNLMGLGQTRGGTQDAAEILKGPLEEGDLWSMLFTTRNEYTATLEKDGAIVRRTQPVRVDEPSLDETFEILEGIKGKYEAHYGMDFPSAEIAEAVHLADRYIGDRNFPDKGKTVIDTAGGIAFDQGKTVIDREAIIGAVSELSGLEAKFIGQEDEERYAQMGGALRGHVFGQDQAVDRVAFSMAVAKAGLRPPNKPIGSFLFVGPTGVGKTELTKALALHGLGSADRMLRLDMSEYMEKHSASKLIGAPPGYVGFDQEGLLTEPVRQQPYQVVLFDEIEKAHPDVYNILLQVLDNGKLQDSKGREVDFRNTIVVLTSNLGAADAQAEMTKPTVGFGERQREAPTDIMMRAVENHFTPEFRNRLSAVVPFYQLQMEQMRPILDANIAQLKEQTRMNWNVELEIGEEAHGQLIKAGFNPIFGARPLDRALTDMVRKPLAVWLLQNRDVRDRPGSTLTIDKVGKEDFKIRMEDPTGAPIVPEDATPYARALASRLRDRRADAAKPPADPRRQRVM